MTMTRAHQSAARQGQPHAQLLPLHPGDKDRCEKEGADPYKDSPT